jgi:hypothetical protein
MENNRNWQGWIALALAGLALLVALGGRNSGSAVTVRVEGPGDAQAWAQPVNPRAQQGPRWHDEWRAPAPPNAPGFGPGAQRFERGFHGGFDREHRGHGFPFFLPFILVGGLIKLAGVLLIGWLLLRFFRSRRDRPQPPTTV